MEPIAIGVVIVLGVILFVYLASKSAPEEVVKQALENGARVIDVRTQREFQGGHYPGAVNIPVDQISARTKTLGDPSKTLVVYCHSGMRSASARKTLLGKGFKNVLNAGTYPRIMKITSKKKK